MTFLWLLEGIRTPFLNDMMQLVTYFGQELIIIAVICAFYWCADKRFAYLLGFTYFTAGLCVQTLKITFRIPRPWILDKDFHAVESALPGATGYSFPSGHTQGAVCLFFPLSLRARYVWQKLLCISAFLLIGFSRMYLGCHTPKDVLTSLVISIVITCILWHFRKFLSESASYLKWITCVLTAIALAVAAYSLFLNANGTIETKYAEDCCKAAGAGIGFALGFYIERRFLNFDCTTGNKKAKFLRLLLGLIFTFLLKEGISLILGSSVLAKTAEYFILVLWILIIYPYLYFKIQRRNL